MKQTILRYGLLSGAVAAVLMVATAFRLKSSTNFEHEYFYGYAGILLSMLFVFFGVRSYREQMNGGVLSFGKGFQVGLLIAIISCVCYVLTWMIVSEMIMPDFMDNYLAHSLEQLQQSGAAQAEIEQKTAEMQQFKEMYKNPLIKFGLTFLEPFPVGFLVSLISALVLRKRAV
ncbi:MAG: DUF4199 domain-containing protein [Phycisphaerae bacterium]|nr:DUF4199 domain-containing protein [Saprospiraceae bacterium]